MIVARRKPGLIAALSVLLLAACDASTPDATASAQSAAAAENETEFAGFVDLYWDDAAGRLKFGIDAFDEPLLYQTSLARGVGSNDLGLDRGQLGETRVVRFLRSGPKVLLVEDNLGYRATNADSAEARAVEESFARSVLWGFQVDSEADGTVRVDATDFFLRDAHGIADRLRELEEGEYAVDASRSAVFLPRTRSFPDNTEVEAIVTFTGRPTGQWLPTVVPDANAVTVHLHHSFVRLPPPGYEPLPYDPRAGVIGLVYQGSGFADYARPIGEPLYVNYARRHRLQKVDPNAAVSEAVEPIVYYLDPGTPEPVRTALLDGARWWNEAFAAAGYKDAFQVRMLPDDADPMDVRYNVIQWVHRSTRGWSYGASVIDPRTGEILKGHVSLGSLRVRQDYLIVEGLLGPYDTDAGADAMLDVALARIRQLSAHEVGHTLGFEHNFAASAQDRASVMDYPFPLVTIGSDGALDFSAAYDEGIGAWDKRVVRYAYQDFGPDVDARAARQAILDATIADGFAYVADADARASGTAHPQGNLWDNGADPIIELEHLLALRSRALERFSERNLKPGLPYATLEEVLVPVYLLHRFQIEAVGKLIGGTRFTYALRGDGQPLPVPVDGIRQRRAIDALLRTLHPDVLALPARIVALIPPRPPGYPLNRETFARETGSTFDPLAPAAAGATLTLDVLLNPQRAARMARSGAPGFGELLDRLLKATWYAGADVDQGDIRRQTNTIVLNSLLRLAVDAEADADVRALALDAVNQLDRWLQAQLPAGRSLRAHYALARHSIARMRDDPASVGELPAVNVPPGSPIGAAGH